MGGAGLNFSFASRAVLLEPSWNPSEVEQAIKRLHRKGQTEIVKIWRVYAVETLEENIIKFYQERK